MSGSIKPKPNYRNTSLEINLEELHPLDFRLAFGLTHEEAAVELCLEPQTMRAYSKNRPSRRVRKLAATIAKRWVDSGREVVDGKYLESDRLSSLYDL